MHPTHGPMLDATNIQVTGLPFRPRVTIPHSTIVAMGWDHHTGCNTMVVEGVLEVRRTEPGYPHTNSVMKMRNYTPKNGEIRMAMTLQGSKVKQVRRKQKWLRMCRYKGVLVLHG